VSEDVFDELSEVVPGAIATAGIHPKLRSGTPRADRTLGKQGADLLGAVPLFAGLSRRHLRRLAEHADVATFRPKEAIVRQDRPGGSFYVITQGEAKVIQDGRTISTLGPGDFFGEISLLDGGPRTADVIAVTPVSAIRVFKSAFDQMVAEEPGVAARILAVVARRLREAERSLHS
jgi:CRP-like cAMP-binding protein